MDDTDRLSRFLSQAERIAVFTGAGISTESGIPDYRSKGGLWDRFRPVTFQEFLASEAKREEYWAYKLDFMERVMRSFPNPAHEALVKIEKKGKLKGIVTQNIDGLHQKAGTSREKIVELHGTNWETICLDCGDLRPWDEAHEKLKRGEKIPLCKICRGLLKPNTISFGQPLDMTVYGRAKRWMEDCDLILAIGSTLIVEPAASLPLYARQCGAKLVIITLSATPLDEMAEMKVSVPAGEILSKAMNALGK